MVKKTKKKIAQFCDTDREAVIEMLDADTLYDIPIALQEQHFDDLVCRHLHLPETTAEMDGWKELVRKVRNLSKVINVALVGKYVELPDAYLSLVESLKHAGFDYDTDVSIRWVDSETLDKATIEEELAGVDGIVVPGGFGRRGMDGKIEAIQYARENNIPFLGVCLGMQLAVVEYARNVLGLEDAHSVEINPETSHPVVTLVNGQSETEGIGGTLQLGSFGVHLQDDTKIKQAYRNESYIEERHRHRYEVNPSYETQLAEAGMLVSAYGENAQAIKAIELASHPWFVACQYHPEFKSRPTKSHPLLAAFVGAMDEYKRNTK